MENSHGETEFALIPDTPPPSYSATFQTQSDEHGACSFVTPYPMLMPSPPGSQRISEEAQEDEKSTLQTENVHSDDINLLNEEYEAEYHGDNRTASQCLRNVSIIVC